MTDEWQGPEEDDEDEITPHDPDWDLSEGHGYMWEPERRDWLVSPGVLALVSIVLIVALVLPAILLILR